MNGTISLTIVLIKFARSLSFKNVKFDLYTKITEVNLSMFVYRLFHKDCFPLIRTHQLSIEHSTTCNSRTNLNYIYVTYI